MNNFIIQNTIRYIIFVLLQVLIFNNINLFGYLNPSIYIIFIFLYPLRKEKGNFLIISFLLGLTIDILLNSGGINAAATLFIAYFRLPILSYVIRKNDFDYQLFNIRAISYGKSISYIFLITLIHNLIIYSLEYFSFNDFFEIIKKTFLSTFFTVIIINMTLILFTKKR